MKRLMKARLNAKDATATGTNATTIDANAISVDANSTTMAENAITTAANASTMAANAIRTTANAKNANRANTFAKLTDSFATTSANRANMPNFEKMGEYERRCMENKLRNMKLLEELGIRAEKRALDEQIQKYGEERAKAIAKKKSGENKKKAADYAERGTVAEVRRSLRVQGKPVDYTFREYERLFLGPIRKRRLSPDGGDAHSHKHGAKILDPSTYQFQRPAEPRFNQYGEIEGVQVGQEFQSRMECSYAGIHRPPVSGIHQGPDGAYSVVMNGGYEDDVDLGETFTYTGEGGRDLRGTKNQPKNLRSAPQSCDQTLTRGNLALYQSIGSKNPVRVVRGYRLNNRYAPLSGYRYDGLYTVEKYELAQGLSFFNVYRFTLVRSPGQDPLPV